MPDYERKSLMVYRQGRTVTDQFYIDDDYNVPDVKHDVKAIILSDGELQIEEMKIVESYLRVSGKLNFRMLYVTEEGELKPGELRGRIPFEEMIYLEEAPEETLFVKSRSADLTVTMIHSRKLNIKALVELQISSGGKAEASFTTDISDDCRLYKRHQKQKFLRLLTIKKDTYRIKEEAAIAGTKENIGLLLWTELIARKLDIRLVADELLLTGELLLFVFYESAEGKLDWMEQTISYEGRMECYGAQENMFHQIYPELTDINVEPRMDEDGEMRILGVEATLEARITVYEEVECELLEDVYALDRACHVKRETLQTEQMLMQNHSRCKVSEQLSLPEIKDDILQVCHSSGSIQVDHMEVLPGGVQIEGVLNICFLFVKSDDSVPFGVWQGMVPFTHLLESNETVKDMVCDLTYSVEQLSIGLLGGDTIEVKAVLAFNSFLKQPIEISNIEEIKYEPVDMEEMERRPGIIGYIVKEGDSLWELAKRYSTTVEGIMSVNEKMQEEINPGEKLLIFKENMGIL